MAHGLARQGESWYTIPGATDASSLVPRAVLSVGGRLVVGGVGMRRIRAKSGRLQKRQKI